MSDPRPTLRTIDPYPRVFGAAHDPVLHGVACGLAELFPPVEHPVWTGEAAGSARRPAQIGGEPDHGDVASETWL